MEQPPRGEEKVAATFTSNTQKIMDTIRSMEVELPPEQTSTTRPTTRDEGEEACEDMSALIQTLETLNGPGALQYQDANAAHQMIAAIDHTLKRQERRVREREIRGVREPEGRTTARVVLRALHYLVSLVPMTQPAHLKYPHPPPL